MDDLIIKGSGNTPGVYISKGVFLFQGKSLLKKDKSFFQPIINYAKKYIKAPNKTTTIKVMLEYMDAKSSQSIYHLLEILKNINHEKHDLRIIWCYTHGDVEMVELGEILQGRLEIDFEFEEFETIPRTEYNVS